MVWRRLAGEVLKTFIHGSPEMNDSGTSYLDLISRIPVYTRAPNRNYVQDLLTLRTQNRAPLDNEMTS
jgi:hypothetical protein